MASSSVHRLWMKLLFSFTLCFICFCKIVSAFVDYWVWVQGVKLVRWVRCFACPLRVWVWFPNSVTWTCSKNIIFERVSVTVYDKVYYYTNFSFQTTTNIANVYKKTFFPTYRNLHYLQSLLTYKARSCQVSSSCLQYTSSIAIKFDAELAVNLDSICTPLSI